MLELCLLVNTKSLNHRFSWIEKLSLNNYTSYIKILVWITSLTLDKVKSLFARKSCKKWINKNIRSKNKLTKNFYKNVYTGYVICRKA